MRWKASSFIILLTALAWFGWSRWPRPLSPRQEMATAAFLRPTEVTPGLVNSIEIRINGIDWLREQVSIAAGSEYRLNVVWHGEQHHDEFQTVHIYPRPVAAPDFSFSDFRADSMILAGQAPKSCLMRLAPGRYLTRFYLDTWGVPPDIKSQLVDLIAERELVVTEGETKSSGIVLGDSRKERMPVAVTQYGPRHPEAE